MIPVFANPPSNAVVLSTLTPTADAAGATIFKLSLNLSKSKAVVEVLLAKTSTNLCVSSVSKPNARTVDPAKAAASLNPISKDAAKSKIAGVEFSMSCNENPNLANSVCKPKTCFAVKAVVDPNCFA